MSRERNDPRFVLNLRNNKPKAQLEKPHAVLDALLSRLPQNPEKTEPLFTPPVDYTGLAYLKDGQSNIPIWILKQLGYKDDFDNRPHVQAVLKVEDEEYRFDKPIPLENIVVNVSLVQQWKAEKKRNKRTERNRKNLSSKK